MYLSEVTVKNYKSFYQPQTIRLTPGMNVITGQNNAGKSALLQLLSLSFENVPHASTRSLPGRINTAIKESLAEIEINIPRDELYDYLYNSDIIQLFLIQNHITENQMFLGRFVEADFVPEFFPENVCIRGRVLEKGTCQTFFLDVGEIKSNENAYYVFDVDKINKTLKRAGVISHPGARHPEETSSQIARRLIRRIYLFKAERMNVGLYRFGHQSELLPDASNLPEVLNAMQSNSIKFQKYNQYIRRIFPQIHGVSVRPQPNNNVQIVVWNEDQQLQREDLVVPLDKCGTGVSQVLAILYVVLTSDVPKIIIIDEPNSFLHPGAARKLIEILKEHPQHQFIISSHAPSTIAAANPQTINIVKYENAQSTIEEVDVRETNNQRLYLAEIGAKLSDVFGADNILWVEGKTEEICFPKIVEKEEGLSLMGTTILAVKNTGDFEKKHLKNAVDIYNKLSKGKGLMPPAVGFYFDRENRSAKDMEDAQRQSKNIVFSKRKMFENYLLNIQAIAFVLDESREKITEEKIAEWLEANKWKVAFISREQKGGKSEEEWLNEVDGAKLLDRLFTELSEGQVAFDKITHSVKLCEWIIDNSFDELLDIRQQLRQLLDHK